MSDQARNVILEFTLLAALAILAIFIISVFVQSFSSEDGTWAIAGSILLGCSLIALAIWKRR